jgi:hypothetical protein
MSETKYLKELKYLLNPQQEVPWASKTPVKQNLVPDIIVPENKENYEVSAWFAEYQSVWY